MSEPMEALARVIGEHSADMSDERLIDGQWVYGACCECGEFVPLDNSLGFVAHVASAILAAGYLSPEQAAAQIAAAEQRGREDNADHGMCYVAGSEALAARERQAGAAVLREAAAEVRTLDDCILSNPYAVIDMAADIVESRAERLEAGE